jgi:hypothetical protein
MLRCGLQICTIACGCHVSLPHVQRGSDRVPDFQKLIPAEMEATVLGVDAILYVQQARPVVVLRRYICGVLDEKACKILPSFRRHQVQWDEPVLVLGCHIRTVFNEQAREIHTCQLRC